jgi:hypothetical protein
MHEQWRKLFRVNRLSCSKRISSKRQYLRFRTVNVHFVLFLVHVFRPIEEHFIKEIVHCNSWLFIWRRRPYVRWKCMLLECSGWRSSNVIGYHYSFYGGNLSFEVTNPFSHSDCSNRRSRNVIGRNLSFRGRNIFFEVMNPLVQLRSFHLHMNVIQTGTGTENRSQNYS